MAGSDVFEGEATAVNPLPGRATAEHATPTVIEPSLRAHDAERSAPIRVISMKDAADTTRPRADKPRVSFHVHLRSMAQAAGLRDTPAGLGNLAPPRDLRQAQARRRRDNLFWVCIAVALACAITLVIWYVVGK